MIDPIATFEGILKAMVIENIALHEFQFLRSYNRIEKEIKIILTQIIIDQDLTNLRTLNQALNQTQPNVTDSSGD